MKEKIYSFIIPHKNCPDLLNRCLDSIPVRGDIQVIVVDDNSDADKKPIINRGDVELVLLDAMNSKGVGHARNVGIEKAFGKWLLFPDEIRCRTHCCIVEAGLHRVTLYQRGDSW